MAGGGPEIRPFSSILGPEIRTKSIFNFFFRKKIKKGKKTGNSIQSGPNLRSFAFKRGGRVSKLVQGPSFEGLGPTKISLWGPKRKSGFVFFCLFF